MDKQSYIQALLKYLGQPVESEDPTALDQCMDWAFKGCDILGIDRSAIRHGYAYEVWKNPTDTLVLNYEVIPNTPNGAPQAGDTVIFDQNVLGVTGGAGHICIVEKDGDANSFTSLDQNWNGVQEVTEVTHDYVGVLGWLRPKIFHQLEDDAVRQAGDTNWNLYKVSETHVTSLEQQLTECQNKPADQPPSQPPQSTDPKDIVLSEMKDELYGEDSHLAKVFKIAWLVLQTNV